MGRPWREPPAASQGEKQAQPRLLRRLPSPTQARKLSVRDLRRLGCVGHRLILGKDRSWWFGP